MGWDMGDGGGERIAEESEGVDEEVRNDVTEW